MEDKKALITSLMGTILLDTYNLDPRLVRVTYRDTHMLDILHHFLPHIKTIDFYHSLLEAKFNVTGLLTSELLYKDYKDYTTKTVAYGTVHYGISAITENITRFIQNDNKLIQNLDTFINKEKLDILIVQNYSYRRGKENDFYRELIVYDKKEKLGKDLTNHLLDQGKSILDLVSYSDSSTKKLINDNPGIQIWFFEQHNLASGRKYLQPLVKNILEQL